MSERIIMDEAAVQRTVTRIAHEILEYNKGTDNLVLLGIKTRGEFLAQRIQERILKIEQQLVPTGTIDVTSFRDDIELTEQTSSQLAYDIDVDITGKVVIIIDDVLYTGRTVRASLDAILKHSRPIKIGLAALVDRGHRELPIRADFVGKTYRLPKRISFSIFSRKDSRTAVVIS